MADSLIERLEALADSCGSETHGRDPVTTIDGPPELAIALLREAAALLSYAQTLERDRDAAMLAAKHHADRVDTLLARVEASERDAGRYRRWRLLAVSGTMSDAVCERMIAARAEDDVDAAIDQAIRGMGGRK